MSNQAKEKVNTYEVAKRRLKKATEELALPASVYERLKDCDRVLEAAIPVEMDDGTLRVFKGYRAQHNNVLGPYKGGIRFDETVNLDVMKSLAFEQTFKNALTGLPLGGAKGGSDFSSQDKTDSELLSFCQSFVSKTINIIVSNKCG